MTKFEQTYILNDPIYQYGTILDRDAISRSGDISRSRYNREITGPPIEVQSPDRGIYLNLCQMEPHN